MAWLISSVEDVSSTRSSVWSTFQFSRLCLELTGGSATRNRNQGLEEQATATLPSCVEVDSVEPLGFAGSACWRRASEGEGLRLTSGGISRLECRNVSSSRNLHESLQYCRKVSRAGDAEDRGSLKGSRRPPVRGECQLHLSG
jgi:hypothetical protein